LTQPQIPSPHAPAAPAKTAWPDEKIGAFMDIGTHAVRLLLVRITPNRTFTILTQQKELVRLGEGEFVDDHLQPEAMRRAALVCRKFAEMARAYGADEIVAVATAATREAKNQGEFVRMLAQDAGVHIHPIGGLEEARLIYLGVSSGVHLADRRALIVDIGGGSTELVLGDQAQHYFLDSLKLGAIRLTSLFFIPGESGPVTPDRYALLQRYIRNAAVRTVQRLREWPAPDLVIGSSGTIENLADIAARMFLRRPRQRDDRLTHAHLQGVIRELCSLPLEERRKVPGINPARADIIVAGAAILDTLMEELSLDELRVSDRALREGLIVDYLGRAHPDLLGNLGVRDRSVLQLGRACNFDEAHATIVARLALQLFDSARGAGLHAFGDWERELLGHAAMLHDIGTFLSYTNHQAHTYYLIRNADLLGFDQTEITLMALMARFHRKGVPDRREFPELTALGKEARRILRRLSPLLRLAENLDRSHAGLVTRAELEAIDGKRTALNVYSDRDCQLELWGIRAHQSFFEDVYRRKLVVRHVAAEPV